MADRSKIEWTDATWNPIRARHRATGKVGWHCAHVSKGCRHCYAETINRRLGTGLAYKPGHLAEVEIVLDEKTLLQPLHWRRPRMIFVGSMTDLFAGFVTDAMLDRVFAAMALCPQHTFQVLTKRPGRMRSYFTTNGVTGRLHGVIYELLGTLDGSKIKHGGKWAVRPSRCRTSGSAPPARIRRRLTRACPSCWRRRQRCALSRPNRCLGRSISAPAMRERR